MKGPDPDDYEDPDDAPLPEVTDEEREIADNLNGSDMEQSGGVGEGRF